MRHQIMLQHMKDNNRTYKVVEKFVSINGEARKAGELAVFVRFAGCNLNCSYCDTKWANEKNVAYELLTAEEILAYVKSTGVSNVTLTGGEPLKTDGIEDVIDILAKQGFEVEIETNGSVDISKFKNNNEHVSFTVDFKSPGSGMCEYMFMKNYEYVGLNDTVKFVVQDRKDLDKAKEIIDRYKLQERCKAYLSPVFGKIKPEDMVQYMIDNNMNGVRLQLQLHKFIWDPDKKGV